MAHTHTGGGKREREREGGAIAMAGWNIVRNSTFDVQAPASICLLGAPKVVVSELDLLVLGAPLLVGLMDKAQRPVPEQLGERLRRRQRLVDVVKPHACDVNPERPHINERKHRLARIKFFVVLGGFGGGLGGAPDPESAARFQERALILTECESASDKHGLPSW